MMLITAAEIKRHGIRLLLPFFMGPLIKNIRKELMNM